MKFIFQKHLKKIVCLVPSLTELLFDLNLEDSVIGITKFCIHPEKARKTKTIVGGTKNINFDKLEKLQPDIILCNKEENSLEIVEKCSKITTTHVSDIFTLDDTLSLIEDYGKIFNKVDVANVLKTQIKKKENEFLEFINTKQKIKVAYFIWKNPWMVVGKKTFINYLLQINKFDNVFNNEVRYPEIQIDSLITKNIDLIFLSSKPYPFKEKHIAELKKINPNLKVMIVDGEMFSWYGSRLLLAFNYFKKLNKRIRTISL